MTRSNEYDKKPDVFYGERPAFFIFSVLNLDYRLSVDHRLAVDYWLADDHRLHRPSGTFTRRIDNVRSNPIFCDACITQ